MEVIDDDKIINALSGMEFNDEMLSDEDINAYKEIIKKIENNPILLDFLQRKFGEYIANYIYSNVDLLNDYLTDEKNILKQDREGNVILSNNYIEKEHVGTGINVIKWILVGNLPILIKGLDSNNKPITTFISEEIAKQSGMDVAIYYPAILDNKKVIITPSFLKEGEDIIIGKKISYINMDISENPDLIRKYLTEQGASKAEIDNIITKYKCNMLYNIFINSRDGHNGNWGVIRTPDNKFRYAPIFDLEGGLAENYQNIRATYIGDTYNDDNAMLQYLLKDEKVKNYANKLLSINMDEVYDSVMKRKKVTIPNEDQIAVNEVIKSSKEKIRTIIKLMEDNQKDLV